MRKFPALKHEQRLAIALLWLPALAPAASSLSDPRAATFCERLSTESARNRCFEEAGKKPRKHYERSALESCGTLASDKERVRCLIIVREARFFDARPLELCTAMETSEARLTCLGLVAGAWYRPSSLGICRKAATDGDKIRCLAELRE